MEYCEQADIERRIGGTLILAELTNETSGATTADMDVVAALINKAGATIDNVLSGTYEVPIMPVPSILQSIAVDLVCYYAMQRRFAITKVPEQWTEAYKGALESLEKIANLDNALDNVYPVTAPGARMVASDPVVNFANPANKFSSF